MKNKFIKGLVAAGAAVSVPLVAFADAVSEGLSGSGLRSIFGNSGRLGNSQSVMELITNVIRLMLMFTGAIAIIFLVYGGYMYITSAGSAESAEKGKNTVVNALIGIVVIALSYVLVTVVSNLVGNGQI